MVSDNAGIVEAFAQFYEELDRGALVDGPGDETTTAANMAPISEDEVSAALKRLKGGRTGAADGLVSEMLRTGHSGLLKVIAAYFTDTITGTMDPPSEWKVARLSVIFKKGQDLT